MYRPIALGQTDIRGTVYEARLKAQIRARRGREDVLLQERAIREQEEYPETIWERVASCRDGTVGRAAKPFKALRSLFALSTSTGNMLPGMAYPTLIKTSVLTWQALRPQHSESH